MVECRTGWGWAASKGRAAGSPKDLPLAAFAASSWSTKATFWLQETAAAGREQTPTGSFVAAAAAAAAAGAVPLDSSSLARSGGE